MVEDVRHYRVVAKRLEEELQTIRGELLPQFDRTACAQKNGVYYVLAELDVGIEDHLTVWLKMLDSLTLGMLLGGSTLWV